MRTKNIITASLLVSTLFGLGWALPATAEWHPAQEGTQKPQAQTQRRESRIERMARELNLTKDQQTKIEAAFKDQTTRMDAIQAEFRDKRKKLHDEIDGKIMASLTPEQKEKYKSNRQQRLFQNAADIGRKRTDRPSKPVKQP